MVKAPCNLCRINEIETLQKLRALKAGQRELRGVTETLVISTKATHHFPHGPFFIQILLSGDNQFTEVFITLHHARDDATFNVSAVSHPGELHPWTSSTRDYPHNS